MKQVLADEMYRIKNEVGVDWNILFCGYLRQPITSEKGDEGYFIQGKCSLTGKTCLRFIDKNTKRCSHEKTAN